MRVGQGCSEDENKYKQKHDGHVVPETRWFKETGSAYNLVKTS